MPTVFLSYAREDLDQADRITQQLAAEGITVWHDHEQLHAGQTWPKALGEAIAASDALLLLWSSMAAGSTFVELEWSTALALKKKVLPCLLDKTPLPPALAATQAVPLTASVRIISVALGDETKSHGQSHTQKVLHHLAGIGSNDPAEVLRQGKTVFSQDDSMIKGSVYQAMGDIHVGTKAPRKTLLDKWQAWVAIIAGILTAISVGLMLVRSYRPLPKRQDATNSQSVVPYAQSLAGHIEDEAGRPLANVQVKVLLNGQIRKTVVTGSAGEYRFQIDAPAEAWVTLLFQRDGYETAERKTQLGNPDFSFYMRRNQQ
jgi:hypothetical protein